MLLQNAHWSRATDVVVEKLTVEASKHPETCFAFFNQSRSRAYI